MSKPVISEGLWRKAEQNQLMRERRSLIKRGIISTTSVPNILVRGDDGAWKFPAISTR